MKMHSSPFEVNPEQVLQERIKRTRKITREEFLNPPRKGEARQKPPDEKK